MRVKARRVFEVHLGHSCVDGTGHPDRAWTVRRLDGAWLESVLAEAAEGADLYITTRLEERRRKKR